MPLRKSRSGNPGASEKRPAPPEALREDAHPAHKGEETKQPYSTEVADYQGGKTKPPKEAPKTADG
jgi:hypothetical protein